MLKSICVSRSFLKISNSKRFQILWKWIHSRITTESTAERKNVNNSNENNHDFPTMRTQRTNMKLMKIYSKKAKIFIQQTNQIFISNRRFIFTNAISPSTWTFWKRSLEYFTLTSRTIFSFLLSFSFESTKKLKLKWNAMATANVLYLIVREKKKRSWKTFDRIWIYTDRILRHLRVLVCLLFEFLMRFAPSKWIESWEYNSNII